MAHFSKLYLGKDDTGIVTNEIPWPSAEQSNQIVLTSGIEETLAVPSWAWHVLIVVAPGTSVACGYGDTALVLAQDTWINQACENNPILRQLNDPNGNRIDTLRFISYSDGAPLNVIFYAKNSRDNT